MKNKYILYILIGIFFAGCAEDKGNYDYTPINNWEISDIKDAYSTIVGDSLKIPVTLKGSLSNSEDNLTYLWEMDGKVIGTEKNLEVLAPSDMSFGKKECRYTVTDNKNGMEFYKTFSVDLVSPFNWGYYFLTEKEDHSTILSYFSIAENNTQFIHTNSVSGMTFGDNPSSLTGSFGNISALDNYYWTINILTKDGENPAIITNNGTFMPSGVINSSSFIDQNAGYQFAPEYLQLSRQNNVYFISNGEFISYNKGLLYRPAKHDKTYYWSNPAWSQSGYPFMFVFDKLSQKYYTIESQPNAPGITGDSYAYDKVIETINCPSFEGHTIIGKLNEYDTYDYLTAVTANASGINFIKISYDYPKKEGKYVSTVTLPVSGTDSDTKALQIQQDWYFSIGNKIYTSPLLLPQLTPFIDIPEEYGKVINITSSAMGSLLVVATYDKDSQAELKGSVIFIDMQTKKLTGYKHVIDKCVSILSCNGDPWGFGWGGDGK